MNKFDFGTQYAFEKRKTQKHQYQIDSALNSSDDSEYEQYSLDEKQHYKTPKPTKPLKSILKPKETINSK